jgi:hypothetical protein
MTATDVPRRDQLVKFTNILVGLTSLVERVNSCGQARGGDDQVVATADDRDPHGM